MRRLLTSKAGTYMVTMTQFTPSGSVNTLNRTDWMIAFTVSSIPTMTHSQTNAMATVRGGCEGRSMPAGRGVPLSGRHIRSLSGIPLARRGRPRPGARIVPPTMRNAWTHSRGTKASSGGSPDRRGATYQNAMSQYATRLNVN